MPPPNAQSSRIIGKDFYVYNVSFAALAAGASANGQINIEADADFVVEKLSYSADIAAAAQTDSGRVIPLIKAMITDTGSGRQLFSEAIPVPNVFGLGHIPFIIPLPRLFKANTTIAVALTNYDAATTYNLYLSFIGRKIYKR